jgi:hypothetical protein
MSKITNTNIQQIIFPPGYEIKKIKKKKKKKGIGNRRKKALEELKNVLTEFDSIVNEAKEKNIEIPKELGELPVNVNEINTISEIETLTADLRERISKINALLSTTTRKQRAISMFDMPQRAGIFPQQPQVFPNFTPTFIPRPPGIPTGTTPTTTTTTTGTSTGTSTGATKGLDDIAKEIESKLTPEQREEAIRKRKEIELREKAKRPVQGEDEKEAKERMKKEDPIVPLSEKYKIDNYKFRSQIPTEEDQRILGDRFIEPMINANRGDPNSGTGLYDKFREVRNWMDKLKKKVKADPADPDRYLMDASEAKLQRGKIKLLRTSYEYFISQLSPEQLQSIEDISPLKRMDDSINQILSQPVQITATEELQALKGRKSIQVFILDPMRPAPLPSPKKKPAGTSPPKGTSTSTDDDEPDSPVAKKVSPKKMPVAIWIVPESGIEKKGMKSFNKLMDYAQANANFSGKVKNFTKPIKNSVRQLVSQIQEAESKISARVPEYKPEWKTSPDDEVYRLSQIKSGAKQSDEIMKIITHWQRVAGSNDFMYETTATKVSPE